MPCYRHKRNSISDLLSSLTLLFLLFDTVLCVNAACILLSSINKSFEFLHSFCNLKVYELCEDYLRNKLMFNVLIVSWKFREILLFVERVYFEKFRNLSKNKFENLSLGNLF